MYKIISWLWHYTAVEVWEWISKGDPGNNAATENIETGETYQLIVA